MLSRRFWGYVRRHRRAYRLGYAAVVASIVMAQLSPWVLRAAIDGIGRGEAMHRLLLYAGTLLFLALVEAAFSYAMRLQILGAAHKIETELRRDFFAHLQRMDLGFFHGIRTGDLMARAVNDIRAVMRFAGVGLMRSVHTAIMLVASVAFMLTISTRLTLWVMSVLPLVTVLFVVLGREIHRRFDRVQEQFSSLSARAQENFSGIRVVKAFAQEEAECEKFEGENRTVLETNLRLARVQGALWPAIGLILGLAAVVLLWQGGSEVIRGRITLGQMVQFSYYLARLSFPMIALGWVLTLWQQGRASMERLDEIFNTLPRIADPKDPIVLSQPHGEIEFRGVTFAYDGRPVLRGIDLRIPAGSTLAVVGPTGSGKSTLVNLIARLYDPTKGRILLDGYDLRRLALRSLRGAIGFVQQETFLFSDTLRENIAFGLEEPDETRVREAAEISRIARDIQDFPRGYDTVVGERGVTLSGGQKQRTAIARAVARDPRILILDDALSSVDTQTEEEVLHRLREVMASRTSIIISHRISTIRDADWIVVLDDGRIAEQGTHDTLLARGGLYADLYEKQLLREALEATDVPDAADPGSAIGAERTEGEPPTR
ncbi:MAG: ABC transporter ATP-binding protein [Armatimonadota bacterium]|nr:ABC transporter ATP-binding protein [Armatimonadota bacterium]MDR5696341.1 ABC transporter ATP-binding protein [Armatimonadota bacterium]